MNPKKKKALQNIAFLTALFLFFVFTRTVIQPTIVVGQSMEPTLKEGNLLLVNRLAEKYERFDIVVASYENSYLIKRVIGLPGETIQIKNNKIYIDNKEINDVYNGSMDGGMFLEPTLIKENEYVIIGDNRNNSSDSRYFGPVSVDTIMGKAISNK